MTNIVPKSYGRVVGNAPWTHKNSEDVSSASETTPRDILYVADLKRFSAVNVHSTAAVKMRLRVTADPEATLASGDDTKWAPLFYDSSGSEETYDVDGVARFTVESGWAQLRVQVWPASGGSPTVTANIAQRGPV